MGDYWDGRFGHEGRIWGMKPSRTAEYACAAFTKHRACGVLVPGAGYGRNTALFARSGFKVTGIEISPAAVKLALANGDGVKYIQGSFLEVPVESGSFDAVYCFNVLHLFKEADRRLFVAKCADALRDGGIAFFAVFSDTEASFGKGMSTEANTFESKPGRPVHYFTEEDLANHFAGFDVLDSGLIEDPEDHGDEGPHVHMERYILASVRKH
jgi:SAM-dependent methyltransferase